MRALNVERLPCQDLSLNFQSGRIIGPCPAYFGGKRSSLAHFVLMRVFLLLFFGGIFSCPAQTLPWPEGEKLTYLIEWGIVHAAEGTFTATAEHGKEGVQRFDLYLRSRGPIEAFYPIRSRFVSLTQVKPWRSLEYRQDRSEGGNLRTRKTIPEYSVKLGRFWPGPGKPEENFDLPEGPCEDFGSMLYHLRYHPWKKGESIVWNILENKEPLFGRMTCTEIGEIELGDREPRRLIQLRCEPVKAGWICG
ncbi:MAG: DUF3108 domain-containing protein [Verrucomicrobia bacterium]|nr:DUF3108 domain-containing protein [Verrucomicrobiota bacterium]